MLNEVSGIPAQVNLAFMVLVSVLHLSYTNDLRQGGEPHVISVTSARRPSPPTSDPRDAPLSTRHPRGLVLLVGDE